MVTGLLAWTALVSLTGCPAEDGWQQGVEDGVAAGVAALIEAPITAWLEERYAESDE